MWNTKCNLKRSQSDKTCPHCRTEEDTKQHIMVDQKGNNTYNLLDKNEKYREKTFTICNNNKRKKQKKDGTTKQYRRKRFTIEGQANTFRKSNEQTQTQIKKYKINTERRTLKGELGREKQGEQDESRCNIEQKRERTKRKAKASREKNRKNTKSIEEKRRRENGKSHWFLPKRKCIKETEAKERKKMYRQRT